MSKDRLGISLREFLGPVMDFFTKLLSDEGSAWWSEFKKFLRKENCWAANEVAQMAAETLVVAYTCLISGGKKITLAETDGSRTLAEANDVFGWIDPNLTNYGCNIRGKATEKIDVEVHEMIKDGNFEKIFGGFKGELDQMCLPQAQIIDFATNHRNWLRRKGYATFFLFRVGEKLFVARVHVYSGDYLEVSVSRFSSGGVWDAEDRHRVVVPQLVPQPVGI